MTTKTLLESPRTETSDDALLHAVRDPFYRPVKSQLTFRLDADIIHWLRGKGKGYQTWLNAVLRSAMLHDREHNAEKKPTD